MAEPFFREDRKRWYLRVKDGAGRWQSMPCAARTKGEARAMQRELELKSDRQRKGLEPLPTDRWATFDQMLQWFLDGEATRFVSHDKLKSIYTTHFKDSDLARLPPTAVTPGRIEAFLLPKEKYSATYVNHMRRLVHRVFAAAIRVEEWRGSNPAERVRRRREPKRKPSFLEAHEVVATLLEIKPFWRPLYATAIYAGLRKGELAGLERGDVDLARNLILVRHSWSRDFPKGDHEEAIPIHPELKPYLEQALRRAKGQLLFPAPNGKMLPRDFKLAEKLRSAMARAGVVLGYKHICRGCKARRIDSHEDAPDGTIRRCPKCNAKMWPSPQPKPCTFHELRHTTATLLLAAGADLWAVQKMLRHTDAQVTTERYAHLVPGYLQAQIGRLKLTGFASPLLPAAANDEGPTEAPDRNHQDSQEDELERETGFEPATLSLGS
jgi:integrase